MKKNESGTTISRRTALKGGAALGALAVGASRFEAWGAASSGADAASDDLTLWYGQPASAWTEALPIGNGRIGAMIFGGVARERLQLNENTLYAGGPYDPNNPDALKALPLVRELINAGKYAEAEALTDQRLMGKPLEMPSYQTVGSLTLTFGASSFAENYRRDLDLDAALAHVEYRQDGVTFRRETFASAVDQVIVSRLEASTPGALDVTLRFETPMPGETRRDGDALVLAGTNTSQHGLPAAMRYEARVRVLHTGGELETTDTGLRLSGADSAIVLVAIATNYRRYDDLGADPSALTRATLAAAVAKRYEDLRDAHVADHRRQFRRLSLDLGTSDAAKLPTDQRIRDSGKNDDPQLASLYCQYGRYLLIASSRPGGQPANLQGLWNDSLVAPWGSKYTININTEMNYWLAEPANLADCVQPLIALVEDLAVTGARTARVNFGARGWVAHHNTDIWRGTAPIDGAKWGMWSLGGAWLCSNLWDAYDYSRDAAMLKRIYPLLKGSAEFFLDTLVPDPSGQFLVMNPSMSPENVHPFGATLSAGAAVDGQILRDLFAHCIRASEILGVDAAFRADCAARRAKLPPDRVGKAGQLREWIEDWDMEAPEPTHRHTAHLYALFPSEQITVRRTPALAAGAKKSLELRGDLSTGWAIAWRINFWARLREGDHAHQLIKLLLDPSRTYPNMFDAHPPFQIDGNFGGANGMLELLVQCTDGEIELLPALPSAWPTGSVRGLRARGGFELDLAWRDGKLLTAQLRGVPGGAAVLRYGERVKRVSVRRGRSLDITAATFA